MPRYHHPSGRFELDHPSSWTCEPIDERGIQIASTRSPYGAITISPFYTEQLVTTGESPSLRFDAADERDYQTSRVRSWTLAHGGTVLLVTYIASRERSTGEEEEARGIVESLRVHGSEEDELREEFVAIVAAAVEEACGRPVVRVGPAELRVGSSTANLSRLYASLPDDPDAAKEAILEYALELREWVEGTPGFYGLEHGLETVRPMLYRKATVRERGLVARPFARHLALAYVLEWGRGLTAIPDGLPQELEIGLDALHEAALSNLSARPAPPFERISEGIVASDMWDAYTAARIVLPETLEAIRRLLGSGPLLVGLPDRDVLLAADPSEREDLEDLVIDLYGHAEHPLTSALLTVPADGYLGSPPPKKSWWRRLIGD